MEGKKDWLFVLKIRGTPCAAVASPLGCLAAGSGSRCWILRAGLTEGMMEGQRGRVLEGLK